MNKINLVAKIIFISFQALFHVEIKLF